MMKSIIPVLYNLLTFRNAKSCVLGISLVWAAMAGAMPALDTSPIIQSDPRSQSATALDQQCVISYTGMIYSGSSGGGITWPDGSFSGDFGVFSFSNSCGGTLYAYCVDLNHYLNQNPYCVNIDPVPVSNTYPEQAPAMAFIQTWYIPTTNYEDDVRQLTLWKLSSNNANIPYYQINAGRGYPLFTDPPVYPYVNTVYSGDVPRNADANLLVRDALGAVDNLPKNIFMCGDQLQTLVGPNVISGGTTTVTITITLVRGAQALAVNNTSVSGVKLLVTTDAGTLGSAVVYTNALGQAVVTLSQPLVTAVPATVQVCTRGAWPKTITPCNGSAQQLLVQQLQSADVCSLCVQIPVSPDDFLAVELASFTATAGDGAVNVAWSTASENGNDRFELLRDGVLIATPRGAGTTASRSDYHYTDSGLDNDRTYHYALVAVDATGTREELAQTSATPQGHTALVPEYALAQNYPNPFNPTTAISYVLKDAVPVRLTVFDLTGRAVATLVNESQAAGEHRVMFDGSKLATGVYLYRLDAGSFSETRKLMLMK
jgi:hypothetical protein